MDKPMDLQANKDTRPDYVQYRNHAKTILKSLRSEGFVRAVDSWIHKETNGLLELQAEVILLARAAHTLDRLKPKMTDHHKINEAKEALIHYNHAVRNLIWNNPKAIFTNDLIGWLKQSTGDETWAHGIVSGAAGEVAVARVLRGLGGVTSVRLGSVEEDRKGMDVVLTVSSGEKVSVDVKAHNHLPRGGQFIKLATTWIDGMRYHQCEMVVETNHISAAAVLDERAHRSQLCAIQDYLHDFVSSRKQLFTT